MERRDYTKVFDVSRPSMTRPDSTSKPVIVGHHPVMADPMVRSASHSDPDVGFEATPHHSKVIQVSDEAKAHITQAQPPSPEELAVAAALEEKKAVVPPTPTTLASMPASPPLSPAAMPPPVPAQPVLPVPPPPAQDLSHIQHVPVSHMHASPTGRLKMATLWLFITFSLVGFGIYLAIDAGFISTGINLPFHIFSREG